MTFFVVIGAVVSMAFLLAFFLLRRMDAKSFERDLEVRRERLGKLGDTLKYKHSSEPQDVDERVNAN